MENIETRIERIVEPFVKVSYALWVVNKGAISVHVSVDGTEPNPGQVSEILMSRGYVREPLATSAVPWTGHFSLRGEVEIIVSSQPGLDIAATFDNDRLLVAECKGEPTLAATRSGLDRTAFYAAVGQLIIASADLPSRPQCRVVVLADTDRLRRLARSAAHNTLLRRIGMSFALVNRSGNVSELQSS